MAPNASAKVEFVSHLSGTSLAEIVVIGSSVPIAILLRRAASLYPSISRAIPAPLLDYGTVVVIPLAALLLDAHTPAFLFCALLAGVSLSLAASLHRRRHRPPVATAAGDLRLHPASHAPPPSALSGPRRLVFSYFRAGLMLLTCCAILAVDFRAFPRRLAKAETYGAGLMDVGPGSFVFAQGLVVGARAAEAEAVRPAGRVFAARLGRREPTLLGTLARGPLPLLLLGAARLVSTTAVGYQVHVGEYGAHWNFFVTLSVVAAVTTTLGRAPTLPGRRRRMGEGGVAWGSALLSAAILSVHQLALSGAGLNHWVNREERDPDSILDLNKEGIVSSIGYVSIYYAGVAAGAFYSCRCDELAAALGPRLGSLGSTGGGSERAAGAGGWGPKAFPAMLRVWAPVGVLWVALWGLVARVEPISRRSANAPYGVFISAFCCLARGPSEASVAELILLEALFPRVPLRPAAPPSAPPLLPGTAAGLAAAGEGAVRLLASVNDALLPTFLVANLLTGAVNLSMDTLEVTDTAAWMILLGYTALVSAAASLLGRALSGGQR